MDLVGPELVKASRLAALAGHCPEALPAHGLGGLEEKRLPGVGPFPLDHVEREVSERHRRPTLPATGRLRREWLELPGHAIRGRAGHL